jgi:yopX protein
MSREIKFRVYDKEKNMWTNFKILDNTIFFMDKNTGVWFHEKYKAKERFSLMQYTGQKDDYGNEIFEDDFIIDVSEDEDYFLKLIGFGDDDREYSSILKGFKIVKGIQLDLYFEENKFQGKHAYLLEKYKIKIDNECIHFQVIGNKHENPELLELLEEKNG